MRETTKTNHRLRRWALILIAILFSFLLYDQLSHFFTIARIRSYSAPIKVFIEKNYALSLVIYVFLYIIDNVLALPLAAALTITAGYFYGPMVAFLITSLALTVGATIAFYTSRYLVGSLIQQRYGQRLDRFNELCTRYGTYFLVGVRFIPIIPFALVNILAGLTIIPTRTFIWTTLVGMTPVTLLFSISGAQFNQIQSIGDLVTWKVVALFSLLLCILLLPLVLRRRGLRF